MIDTKLGKNNLGAIFNFTPEYPTEMDQGLTRGPCDPWPLSENLVLIADNSQIHGPHGVLQMIDRFGFRTTIRKENDISCFTPVPLKPTPVPQVKPSQVKAGEPGRFFVHHIYDGMPGVKKGEVKQLRILETTTRISGVPPGGRWWNQALLVSWQGSYDVKNYIGVVPVEEDGSAYFEAPVGKALYFQALDKDGRLVQSMRTFVQAVPGITRSCRGCHVKDENTAPLNPGRAALALKKAAVPIKPESWGNGLLDYPAKVQPVLDKHCVGCHGGEKGIAGGIDLSGGWTWAFNISYETLIKNTMAGFLNCNNGAVKTSEILDPRTHGSGAALLGKIAVSNHSGDKMSREDIDTLLAWMDGNCNYHGTCDYSQYATCNAILALETPLAEQMEKAGCVKCHQKDIGNDWINLEKPEYSRILRAPMAKGGNGFGLNWCRDRKAKPPAFKLVTQRYQPPDVFRPYRQPAPDASGSNVVVFAGTDDPVYKEMLSIIRKGREEVLKNPRVDMPGAQVTRGKYRELPPLTPPAPPRLAKKD
jgi:mono/diheme cytochrome c family protein